MSAIKKVSTAHGFSGSGLGHPLSSGVTGPGKSFTGRTMPQDTERKAGDMGEVGEVGSKKVGNVGMSKHKTGGMSRKGNSSIGYSKPKGTN